MERVTKEEFNELRRKASEVFSRNEVNTGTLYYHMPSSKIYPSLFAWDSGYHAAAMLYIDEEKAARELEALFSQIAPDGHIPHETLVPCKETKRSPLKNFTRWMVQWEYDIEGRSHLVDPPIFAYAAELVFSKTGDSDWVSRIWDGLRRSLDYLLDERDFFGDGLVSIVHPWESGCDLSPQLTVPLGIDPKRKSHRLKAFLSAPSLYHFCTKNGWDLQTLKDANRFVVEDLTMNCITIRALRSAAVLGKVIGEEQAVLRYRARAHLMAEKIDELCWDDDAGCYFPRWDLEDPQLSKVMTAQSLLPLFAGYMKKERYERLVEEHLLSPHEFWLEYLIPFNPLCELVGAKPWVDRYLWSGHCIWVNMNWLIVVGLLENGFSDLACEIVLKTAEMIKREGFWEFYDSRNGKGRRVSGFNWPALVLDMIARVWPDITE